MKKIILLCSVMSIGLFLSAQSSDKSVRASIMRMTDEQYPDNNSIGFRSAQAGIYSHNEIIFTPSSTGKFDIVITPGNAKSDSIGLKDINLEEMMPSVPFYVKGNDYLTYLALLNQEWNRIQVKFNNQQFTTNGAVMKIKL